MKKLCLSICFTLFLGLNLFSIDVLAQSCTQLSLPEHAIARLCIPRDRRLEDLDYSPDGKTLASITQPPRQVVLWDIENKTVKLTIDDVNGGSVRYSPDGETLVCGGVLYDAITGQPKLLLVDSDGYRDYVIYSPDGKTVAGAGVKGIRFWNSTADPTTDASPPIGILPTDTSAIDTPKDGFVATPIATSSVTVPRIRGLSYSPDGKELAIACSLGVWIYNAELNTEITLFTQDHGGHRGGVLSVAYSPDGNTIASGDSAHEIHLWDAKSRKHKLTLSKPKIFGQYLSQIPSLKFSPDSNIIVSGSDRSNGDQMYLWDATTGEYKYTLRGHTGNVTSVIFSPDGNTIASTG